MLAQSLDLELNTLYVVCSNFVSTIYVYTSATYQVKINKSTIGRWWERMYFKNWWWIICTVFSCSHLFVFISFRLDTLRKDKKYWVRCNVTKFQSIYVFSTSIGFTNWLSIFVRNALEMQFQKKKSCNL